jgi:predicted site-specific integrase-resolvase
MTDTYVSGKQAIKLLGVHLRTLYNWDKKGKIETIRTPGNKRLYNVNKFLKDMKKKTNKCEDSDSDSSDDEDEEEKKLRIVYTRVSSNGQKDDLERQIAYMKKNYPTHMLIKDIGSGLNMNRSGLRKIIKLAIEGKIDQVVVAYKDRLTRFGFELIEDLIKTYSNGKIVILHKNIVKEPEEELVTDMLQIMNVYIAKLNGLRKYKKKLKEQE